MSEAQIRIKIEELDGNFIFTSNRQIDGEDVSYDLNNVKEIFELNPIPSRHLQMGDFTKDEISFDVNYDVAKEIFNLKMAINNTPTDSRVITPIEMLDMLIDAYSNNMYLTSHTLLASKMAEMVNTLTTRLLLDCKFPKMKFALEGEGSLKIGKERIALFDRVMIDGERNSILLCECIGLIPEETPLSFVFNSSIGITITLENMVKRRNTEHGEVLDISYCIIEYNQQNADIANDSVFERNEKEVTVNNMLSVLPSHHLTNGNISSVIGSCVTAINKTDNDSMVTYIKDKKEILYATSIEDHLINEVEDLFDDLF